MNAERRVDACVTRRNFLTAYTALTAGMLLGVASRARSEPESVGPADPALIEDLVAANRILADQGVVDGYGHVSARHNLDPNRYLLARSVAPELVTAEDIVEFDLDSNAVDPRGRKYYWIGGNEYQHEDIPGSDCNVVLREKRVSVTPLMLDLTDDKNRPRVASWTLDGFRQF